MVEFNLTEAAGNGAIVHWENRLYKISEDGFNTCQFLDSTEDFNNALVSSDPVEIRYFGRNTARQSDLEASTIDVLSSQLDNQDMTTLCN